MMEDLIIMETVEKYLKGEMSASERSHFEQLRSTNPEIDQLVVNHAFFLQSLNHY
jgi:serine protease Do